MRAVSVLVLGFVILSCTVSGCIPRHPPHTPQPLPEVPAPQPERPDQPTKG